MKQSKGRQPKQPDKEEREVVYSQIAQNMEKTRNVVRSSISQASTVSAEERQMALTEKEFSMIKKRWIRLIIDWMSYTKLGIWNMEMQIL